MKCFSITSLSLALVFGLAGCSGGGGGSDREQGTTTLNGSVVKGPISNAQVRVLDAAGTEVAAAANLTNDSGAFSVALPQSAQGPFMLEVTPATDGSTAVLCDFPNGCNGTPFGQTAPFSGQLRALIASDVTAQASMSVNITPFTDAVVARALALGDMTDANLSQANAEVVESLVELLESTDTSSANLTPEELQLAVEIIGDLTDLPAFDLVNLANAELADRGDVDVNTLINATDFGLAFISAALFNDVDGDTTLGEVLANFSQSFADNGQLDSNDSFGTEEVLFNVRNVFQAFADTDSSPLSSAQISVVAGFFDANVDVDNVGFAQEVAAVVDSLDSEIPEATVRTAQFSVARSLGSASFSREGEAGNTLSFDVGFGSGAFHHPSDPETVFYTVTDRGPNINCRDSLELIGIETFCDNGAATDKIFPLPAYSPQIVRFRLVDDASGNLTAAIEQRIPLRGQTGAPVTGLTNDLVVTTTESSFGTDGSDIGHDANGVDTEGLVRLNNGTFWLADEYGPSLIHVAADGEIIERVVPAGLEADLAEADYPVSGLLPEIFRTRRLNRGMEGIAVTEDNNFLYFIMQNPLANPDNAAYNQSRNVRVVKLSLNADGSINQLEGEFLYQMDAPMTFANRAIGEGDLRDGDFETRRNQVRISELVAVGEDDLIVLERISQVTKFYRINLATGTNILGGALDQLATSPSLEEQFIPVADQPAQFVVKHLVFNSLTDTLPDGIQPLENKIESLALLNSTHALLINDNDFGIDGEPNQFTILPIVPQLSGGAAPTTVNLDLANIGRFRDPAAEFDEGAAEIVAYDAQGDRLFVVNAEAATVDVLDLSNPAAPTRTTTLDLAAAATDAGISIDSANSVAVGNGLLAVAIEADVAQDNGIIAVYSLTDLSLVETYGAGALPDMVTFSPDGSLILAANEGEPNDDYSVDPEGSITLVDISNGVVANAPVTQLGFTDFNTGNSRAAELPTTVRIFGPNASVAQDLEPEYIAVSADSQTAFVSLQENNAIAVLDLVNLTVDAILGLGFKDHSLEGNELDASDRDDAINIRTWDNLLGIYQPDAIATYRFQGQNFIVTANEGDARDYDTFSEEFRVNDLTLDPTVFPVEENVADDANLGRLEVTDQDGDLDNDGAFEQIVVFGARSFSIFSEAGELVFDSGSEFERITADIIGSIGFNSTNDENDSFDSRSDAKGPEPEGVAVGTVNDRTYAFIGLERVGGIIIYDITSPFAPQFIQYINNRDFTVADVEVDQASVDLGPEGIAVFEQNGQSFVAVGNEVSGSTTIYPIGTR